MNRKVSIIVPVYNVEKYIGKCLTSLANQSIDSFEIIVVNDGSQDKSKDIAMEFSKTYDNIVVLDKKNGGLSDARNYGINYATGEYLSFIDSDDYIDRDMMESLYNKAKENDADIACCDLMYLDEDGHQKISAGAYFEINSFQDDKKVIEINNSACNKLYKRSFMEGKAFPKGKWYEDLAVIPAWLVMANKIVYVNKPLYYYVQRSGSIVHSIDERIFDVYWAIDNAARIAKEYLGYSCDMNKLYLDNGLIMTTLRIKGFKDTETKKEFIRRNIDFINRYLPNWFILSIKSNEYSIKQKIVFCLIRLHLFSIVLYLFNRGEA